MIVKVSVSMQVLICTALLCMRGMASRSSMLNLFLSFPSTLKVFCLLYLFSILFLYLSHFLSLSVTLSLSRSLCLPVWLSLYLRVSMAWESGCSACECSVRWCRQPGSIWSHMGSTILTFYWNSLGTKMNSSGKKCINQRYWLFILSVFSSYRRND